MALGLVLNEEWSRRLAAKAMVGPQGMVSQHPVGEFPVKGGQVVEPPRLVVVHARFLAGAMDPVGLAGPCRGAGRGPPVGDPAVVVALLEVAQARRAVVGKDERGWGGEQRTQRVEGGGCVAAGGRGGGPGEGEATMGLENREPGAPEPGVQAHPGITREDLQGARVALRGRPGLARPAGRS